MSPIRYNARLHGVLDHVLATTDRAGRREKDPVGIVHEQEDQSEQELVALLASSLAFGNVTTIRNKIREVLHRVGTPLHRAALNKSQIEEALEGWKHRVYCDHDVVGLLHGGAKLQKKYGSLGKCFSSSLSPDGLQPTLSAFVAKIRAAGWSSSKHSKSRGPELSLGARHLLPTPSEGGACKRLVLFLRWMVRPADGVDLGLWSGLMSPAKLVIPTDTHIHRVALNIGLTTRKQVDWTTANEITEALRQYDPNDPVKYDFALCHMGMLQKCPSQRDEVACEGCGVRPVCLHWSTTRLRKPTSPGHAPNSTKRVN